MGFDVGMVVTGKVTGIKKFGAFVSLENGKSGLVHISEVANTYVNDVADHLQDGQDVKVKIISIDDSGRINLSIKKAAEPENDRASHNERQYSGSKPAQRSRQASSNRPSYSGSPVQQAAPRGESSFEDKLKQFMQESNSKISGMEMYSNQKGRRKSRG